MADKTQRLSGHLTPGPNTQPPSVTTVMPASNPSAPAGTKGVPVARTQQTSQLITHISTQDNQLWKTLTSLQNQSNAIVNNGTNWISWNPKVGDENSQPLLTDNLRAYYMVSWQAFYIDLHGTVTTSSAITSQGLPAGKQIVITLPVDIGQTVSKACAAYLMDVNQTDNGIIGVEGQRMSMVLYLKPSFQNGVKGTLMIGGAMGVI